MTSDSPDRRTFVGLLPAVLVATGGCLGRETSGGFSGGAGTSDSGTETTDTEVDDAVGTLRQHLAARDVTVLEVTPEDSRIVVAIQTSGDIDDDIRQSAAAYASVADSIERDLGVRVEDRGQVEETFLIKQPWARRFADERMSDQEYLERIHATREER